MEWRFNDRGWKDLRSDLVDGEYRKTSDVEQSTSRRSVLAKTRSWSILEHQLMTTQTKLSFVVHCDPERPRLVTMEM